MATAKPNYFPDLASYVIRPALVEARLITEKHASDAVYVATLAEELRNIEAKISAMEEATQLGLSMAAIEIRPLSGEKESPDTNWICTKSQELNARLRRVEQSSRLR